MRSAAHAINGIGRKFRRRRQPMRNSAVDWGQACQRLQPRSCCCLPRLQSPSPVTPKLKSTTLRSSPAVLTVKPGTTVVFENHDDTKHLVVDAGGKFRSKALGTNDKFSVTFDKPGELAYFCGLHPHMTGKIIVAP